MHNNVMKVVRLKYLILFVCTMFLGGSIISLLAIPSGAQEKCNCAQKIYEEDHRSNKPLLGVVVPFRDRFEELVEFAPHMHKFLNSQNIRHKIYIINQVDRYRFNRASLINVGFLVAEAEGCDYIAMQDVDLLPLNPDLSYKYPTNGVFHLAAPDIHPKYHYPTFVGGILLITKKDFRRLNGMSNKYWGWGMEDDEFYVRLKSAKIKITRPENITTGINNTFRHLHDPRRRKRDWIKCFNQQEVTRKVNRESGLSDISYKRHPIKELVIEGAQLALVNTELHCNRSVTPWCLCSEAKSSQIQGGVHSLKGATKKGSR